MASELKRREIAARIMEAFAGRTGLTGAAPPRRYLWTDAFAVLNYLRLGQNSLAQELVDQVHQTLGRHRPDDRRRGWLSGLSPEQGQKHPTRAGLRIGKELPERPADEPFQERLEMQRDGQYFHYLTKWARALIQVGHEPWACELMRAAHAGFLAPAKGRMYWKMSIDLSRPLVPSMGHHDPLDGWVTCLQLGAELESQAKDFRAIAQSQDWTTPDALGIGGLLMDAYVVSRLPTQQELLSRLFQAIKSSLGEFHRRGSLRSNPELRLGFRELGLATGLRVMDMEPELQEEILSYWLKPSPRLANWTEHLDINEVMLATALLGLPAVKVPPAPSQTAPAGSSKTSVG